ncbi:hypothetical protein DES53_101361 [Roseimicrobium gellanilyticum]|uniref:Uncharacterized protein n=1 Tax=Roseimicrobium gellanilyticum TaxID=748857 RepID=A0A366HVH8_9BACT|nr:hypothetical protein [Roseimicrobium gellanilyticum]RBP47564.1 hypothetical protein DES53_101361 [Roseimicrobium gellanilyticum]
MKTRTNKLIGPQVAAWLLLTILLLVPVAFLAYFFPWVLGLIFVSGLIVGTVLHAKEKGSWSAVRLFFKEIIWGW